MARRTLKQIVADFDMNLSTSPAYIEYQSLERGHACYGARRAFCRIFGKDAKIPVNERNWNLMAEFEDTSFGPLRRWWIIERFNSRNYHENSGFRDYISTYSNWSELEAVFRKVYPAWYAAQSTNKRRTKVRATS